MRVHFLLGPAGSGKTWRCLAEIRAELKRSPDGPPLLLLAPKQATFQLERQLLDDPDLAGYSRLQIVSFDRLARWLLETFATVPELLDDEGRVMVLRALLAREHASLRVFRATARLPGFARQLSQLLREFQRHQLTPAKLARLADRCAEHAPLRDKLHDLHHLLRAYHEWLEQSEIQDADQLLDVATEFLRTVPSPIAQTLDPRPQTPFPIGGLWLDGFAEMTPQELDLLCAVLPFCRTATLAFCLDPQAADSGSWLSLWSGIRHTYSDCHTRIKALPTCEPSVEELPRHPAHSRFAASPELAHLEASWTAPAASSPSPPSGERSGVRGQTPPVLTSAPAPQVAVLPHPNPLPLGEGTATRTPDRSPPVVPSTASAHPNPSQTASLPLPAGEGRGEGENVLQPAASSRPPHSAFRIPHSAFRSPLSLRLCPNPESEAAHAAREILRHVRAGGRYRDCAVILRTLDHHHTALRRVFTRYGIPFFLDRREPVTHHPLAELTRFALRTLAYGWQPDDLFGALKTGLVHDRDADIDWLENLALAHGWRGPRWLEPLQVPDPKFNLPRAETLRAKLTAPFRKLAEQLAEALRPQTPDPIPHSPLVSGSTLAAALRAFWEALAIETRLAAWDDALAREGGTPVPHSLAPPLHATVLRQMHAWLDNLERAFPDTARADDLQSPSEAPSETIAPLADSAPGGDCKSPAHVEPRPSPAYSLRDWLPILEAGLSSLSVGVIPPALDQVLIGTIDRSRNPELRLALVLGLNEGIFPAPPTPPVLLTEAERELLSLHDTRLGPDARAQIAHERYFAYIACTRSRARLVLTCSAADKDGKPLHPSPILAHIQQRCPGLELEKLPPTQDWRAAEHPDDLLEPILAEMRNEESGLGSGVWGLSARTALPQTPDAIPYPPSLLPVLTRFRELTAARALTTLSPSAVTALYGRDLATSVSKLEQFAECPFKFFVAAGLRAQERKEFELDHRERGSFIHRLLDEFHLRVTAGRDRERDTPVPLSGQIPGRRWRDLSPAEAAALAARIGEDLLASPEFALFAADESRRFTARTLIASAQRLLSALVSWMPHYAFDPVAVELAFGLGPNPPLPALRLALADGNALTLRGRIDRVDLGRDPQTGATLAVVVDYKSSPKKLEPQKVAAGLQLQLLAYLNVLRSGDTPVPDKPCGMRNAECGMPKQQQLDAPSPQATALPHPNPLPLGEGTATDAPGQPQSPIPPSAAAHPSPAQTASLPLPAGEGRGEGERVPPTTAPGTPIPHSALQPCGVFYIPLHGAAPATGSRAEILAEDEADRRTTYQHAGRFDFAHRPALDDRANAQPSGQFRYTLNKDGALSKRSGDALPTAEFTDLLTQVEANLRRLGEAIFVGEVTVAPVRLSASDNACARCDYRPICRFDPWTQPFRALPKPGARTPTSAADAPSPAA